MAIATSKRKPEPGAEGAVTQGPPSRLGEELRVTGRLATKGELAVEGAVVGDIFAARFVLESGGYFEGNVVAQEVLIHGHLDGRVIAPVVKVGVNATVNGKVFHHTIMVEEGARLDARFPWRPMNYFEEGQYELQET
ncbi:MAG: polymer-forming cytoskeletal protein [Rhodovibrionaceae bacterium]|nr:polymer-forming cytoskeletal protein [Rhodovibrionaceae bacterium]